MKLFYFIIQISFLISHVKSSNEIDFEEESLKDRYLDTHQLITKYKYNAETHFVQTEDGYILRMHRIAKPNGKPFFLMHGMGETSGGFVVSGPRRALGYYLSDMGYDVWIGNSRGTRYSRNHTKLNPDSDDIFWNFSWHEIGIYDLPAMIDYVLNFTKNEKLFYVGFSQGTTSFFVMASKKPEYNEKIILMQALAPNAVLKTFKSPLAGLLRNLITPQLTNFLNNFPQVLTMDPKITVPFCKNFMCVCLQTILMLVGPNTNQLNLTLLKIALGHTSAYARQQLSHYIQSYRSKKFREYDFGQKKNLKKYGQIIPPQYNMSKITAPIYLYYSLNDYLATAENVEFLIKSLPNVQGKYVDPIKDWSHLDFQYGIDAREMIYKKINDEARKFLNY